MNLPQPIRSLRLSHVLELFGQTLMGLKRAYFWKYVLYTFLLTSILFTVLTAGTFSVLGYFIGGDATDGFFSGALGTIFAFVIMFALFPLTFPLISLIFLDAIAGGVERQEYEGIQASDNSIASQIWPTIAFIFISIGLNLLILPLIFIPPLYFVAYLAMNGYLLGREYGEMILQRYVSVKQAIAIRKEYSRRFWFSGIVIAFIFPMPIVNLFSPIISTIFMVHLVQRTPYGDGDSNHTPDSAPKSTKNAQSKSIPKANLLER